MSERCNSYAVGDSRHMAVLDDDVEGIMQRSIGIVCRDPFDIGDPPRRCQYCHNKRIRR
jgi:hypothetical protein